MRRPQVDRHHDVAGPRLVVVQDGEAHGRHGAVGEADLDLVADGEAELLGGLHRHGQVRVADRGHVAGDDLHVEHLGHASGVGEAQLPHVAVDGGGTEAGAGGRLDLVEGEDAVDGVRADAGATPRGGLHHEVGAEGALDLPLDGLGHRGAEDREEADDGHADEQRGRRARGAPGVAHRVAPGQVAADAAEAQRRAEQAPDGAGRGRAEQQDAHDQDERAHPGPGHAPLARAAAQHEGGAAGDRHQAGDHAAPVDPRRLVGHLAQGGQRGHPRRRATPGRGHRRR